VLLDLQKLHLQPDVKSLISDIRAGFSSAVVALSELNTNMMMCVKFGLRVVGLFLTLQIFAETCQYCAG